MATNDDIAILYLEDSLELGMLQLAMLEHLGYQNVRHTMTCADAIQDMADHAFDICLMDIRLSDETCEAATVEALSRNIPVILTSGGETLDNRKIAEKCVYLRKPVSPDDLVQALTNAVR